MLGKIKDFWQQFKDDEPGERLQNLHERVHSDETPTWLRWLLPFIGLAITAAGVVLIPAPGPGTLTLFLGLGLVATESKPLARFLDKMEVMARAAKEELKVWWKNSTIWAKAGIEALVTATAAAGGYVGYHIFLDG